MSVTTIQNSTTVISTQYQTPSGITSPQNNGTLPATSSQPTTGNTLSPDQVRISTPVTLKNLDAVKALEQLHNKMNALIKGVRATNEAINNVSEQTSQMSASLEAITKNFPPFPKDSKERQELLMSYNSIRQEILKMSVPAPPAPVYEKVQTMWDSLFSQNGQMLPTAVSALENSSSDQQVQDTSKQVQGLSSKLSSLSSATTQALVQA